MTFEEYSSLPNKLWWQITDQGYWNAGFAAGAASQAMAITAKDAEIAELVAALKFFRDTAVCQADIDVAEEALTKVRKP